MRKATRRSGRISGETNCGAAGPPRPACAGAAGALGGCCAKVESPPAPTSAQVTAAITSTRVKTDRPSDRPFLKGRPSGWPLQFTVIDILHSSVWSVSSVESNRQRRVVSHHVASGSDPTHLTYPTHQTHPTDQAHLARAGAASYRILHGVRSVRRWPRRACRLRHELQLPALIVERQPVALLRRREAALRAQRQPFERHEP